MKPFAIIILIYGSILLLFFALIWWLLFASPVNIPEFIPSTPIKVNGLLLTGSILAVLIICEKKAVKIDASISFIKLMLTGALVVILAELAFQILMTFVLTDYTTGEFLLGMIGIGIYGAILSGLIAFQLKTKRTGLLILFIGGLVVIAKVLAYFHLLSK
jgi:hypothetical protein